MLDVAQNSLSAGAANVRLSVCDDAQGIRRLSVEDDGCGMSEEMLRRVCSPFATSRTTRRVGLGIPLLKMAAELTGGGLSIESRQGQGTSVEARFVLGHIDCPPLGDMGGTMQLLIQQRPDIHFVYRRSVPGGGFELDTDELKIQLEEVPLDHPDVLAFIRQFVNEQEKQLVEVHE